MENAPDDGLTDSRKRKRDVDEPPSPNEGAADANTEVQEEEEVKVLSHKDQRRLKKKQKLPAAAEPPTDTDILKTDKSQSNKRRKSRKKDDEEQLQDKLPKRQNSVWVGNLSYRTTPDSLRVFFNNAGSGEVTRVHMPTKGAPGVEKMKGVKTVGENRGFAYVDFSTPEGKALAISLSEKNLDGRRLLIKDGDDFAGRPTLPATSTTGLGVEDTNTSEQDPTSSNPPASSSDPQPKQTGFSLGPTKTAKKILKAQKQPPCPCLFLGNLGFEATEEKIQQMFEGRAHAIALMRAKKKREREKKKSTKDAKGKDGDLMGIEDEEKDEVEEDIEVELDVGIRKVRMGTFEDSGACKGFAFVDFTSTQHATAALINPANHFLDGRALVVEYASLDAARRGGYRPGVEKKEREMKIKEKISNRVGKDKYNDWKKLRPGRGNNEGNAANVGLETGQTQEAQAEYEEPKSKRSRTDTKDAALTKIKATRPSKERRQKPGAALASAQREKYAIVPSEGTRLKFS